MKTLCLFTMIVCAALMRTVCYADPPAPAPEQSYSESSNRAADNHSSDANHAASIDDGKHQMEGKHSSTSDQSGQNNQTSAPQAASQSPNNQEPSHAQANNNANTAPSNPTIEAVNPRQSGSSKSVGAVTMPSGNKTPGLHNLTAQLPSVIQPAGPLLKDVHNRGPAPAVIGGPLNSQHRITAVINGATMNRRR